MNILIIDDDKSVIEDLVWEFNESGFKHEITTVETVSDACRKITGGQFDLVITDTCFGVNPDSAPIIRLAKEAGMKVCSMSSEDSYESYCLDAGADTFFLKYDEGFRSLLHLIVEQANRLSS